MDEITDDPNIDGITSEPLRRAIGDRYLTYALSTIMHRALPDARDGLKPVHRRILYAMRELRLSATGGFRKSAKISGDVMGNYHPHGDAAIYDAMARLAQDFNVRYTLVDGQGNFGNIDGDNPAASRYTEARMTAVAEALLEGLNENAVDFRENYDGTLSEPVVLPASFPNLLANGSSGIAVGMATNIPPHNIAELCDACLHLIKTPEARDDTLLTYVKGPDFPTGGVIVGRKLRDGDRVLIVEDVTTAGTSIRETVPVLRAAAKVELAGLIVSVNRMERGTTDQTALDELAAEFAMPTRSIVDLDEILEHLGDRLGDEDRGRIVAYRERYGAAVS